MMRFIILLPSFFFFFHAAAQKHGFETLGQKNISVKTKIMEPGLFSRVEEGKQGFKFKIKNNGDETIELAFQLFIYEDGKAISQSQMVKSCIKSRKKSIHIFIENELKEKHDWQIENLSVSIVEDCPSK